jgi:hypothetical protein
VAKTINIKSCRICGNPHPGLLIESEEDVVYRGEHDTTETDNDTVWIIVRCPKTSEPFKVKVRKRDLQ